ncbi:MAG TPA: DUF2182 domain-containing protein [Miltoncostaeaceae bacterium]|nr:DUF2182 domain-containing protein [Miltoncostaeaceae bacterium]
MTARRLAAGGEAGLALLLLGLAAVAWLVVDRRMSGMDGGPWTDLGAIGFYVPSWVAMTAAMMFPALVPMVVIRSRIDASMPDAPGGSLRSALFVGGYLAAWTAYGLAAFGALALVQRLWGGALDWGAGGRAAAAATLVAAALYQVTPAKWRCLARCRAPFTFLMGGWRPGARGALRMGLGHGAWCVACCWALMAALFALGVMSVGWMLLVAGLIAVERLLPWGARSVSMAIALVLLTLGVGVAAAPGSVPGLTRPDGGLACSGPPAASSMGMAGGSQGMCNS